MGPLSLVQLTVRLSQIDSTGETAASAAVPFTSQYLRSLEAVFRVFVLCRTVHVSPCLPCHLRHRHVSALLLDSDDGYVPAASSEVDGSLGTNNGNGRHRDAAKKRWLRAM